MYTSGIKPPWSSANKERQARNEALLLRANCDAETMEKRIIWTGIYRSGPIHLASSWEGNSPARNDKAYTELPRL